MKRAVLGLCVVVAIAGGWAVIERSPKRPASDLPASLTDDEGVPLRLGAPPRKIVSIGPHLTETLFAIGAGRKIVGVGAGESRPAEATALPQVVGDDGVTPDPVRIGQLAPDLVITSAPDAPWKQALRAADIDVFTLTATSLSDAVRDIATLGRISGAGARADDLTSAIREQLQGRTAGSDDPRPAVFIETFYPPLTGAEVGSYVDDLIVAAGGAPVARPKGAGRAWTVEQVAAEDPDVYLAPLSSARSVAELSARPGFASLRAVREGAVIVVADDVLFSPGPRLGRDFARLASLLRKYN